LLKPKVLKASCSFLKSSVLTSLQKTIKGFALDYFYAFQIEDFNKPYKPSENHNAF